MRGMSLQPTGSLRGHWLRQIKENPTKAFGHCKGIVFHSEHINSEPENTYKHRCKSEVGKIKARGN